MAKQDIRTSYDENTQGTVADCAAGLGVNVTYVYKALKESPKKIEPVFYFRKGDRGKGSAVYNFSDMEECYNAWEENRGGGSGDMVDDYDRSTHCTLDEYAARDDVEYSKSQLYVMLKDIELEPEFKYRPQGKKGRGSPVYTIDAVRQGVEKYIEKSYDQETHATMEDIEQMFPDAWGINRSMISVFLRLYNVPVDHKYRKPGGRPTGVYARDLVQSKIDSLSSARVD